VQGVRDFIVGRQQDEFLQKALITKLTGKVAAQKANIFGDIVESFLGEGRWVIVIDRLHE